MPILCANNSVYAGANLSDGVMIVATYRTRHVATRDMTNIQLHYINGIGVNENGTGAVAYKAAVECTRFGAGYVAVLFGGAASSAAIATNNKVSSDSTNLPATIRKGDAFFVRTRVLVAAGQRWGNNATMTSTPNPPYGDGVSPNVDSAYGTGLMTAGASNSAMVVPVAITTNLATDVPSVVIYGDSIPTGGSDIQDGIYSLGYLVRALNRTVASASIPYANLAMSGETAQLFVAGGAVRKSMLTLFTARDQIIAYGTNDLTAGRTALQLQADLQAIYTERSAYGRLWACTILPRTTSTDAWATTGNQTPVTGHTVGGPREATNAWIRTTPGPLTGVIDVADVVESARNSGVWKPNLTVDGIHPNSTASKAMGGVVPISRFLAATPLQAIA